MSTKALPGFIPEHFTHEGEKRTVFRAGEGPVVIVMTEVPGITPAVHQFACRVRDAGFTVYVPQLFGTPMKDFSLAYAARTLSRVCISKTFRVLASRESSPIVDWLRALARHLHDRHGGAGVGAVGMCLTGNFGLAMMLDAPVIAPVLSQPSLPFPIGADRRQALHASDAAIAAAHQKIDQEGAGILALRFKGDPACPGERFERLRREFGDAFEGIEIDDKHANPEGPKPPHSVLTNHLIDKQGEPTREALDRTLAFLRTHLYANAASIQ